MTEVWKPVRRYEDNYIVSDQGRVARLPYRQRNNYGDRRKFKHYGLRLLTPEPNRAGYIRVTLWKYGKRERHLLHRLVAKTFIPNPENKPEVNHKDCCITHNKKENLEWMTRQENIDHIPPPF